MGEILVEIGVLTEEKLAAALSLQKKKGNKLGTVLLEAGFVTETRLVQALSRQLAIPWVSLRHIDVSDELLALVPAGVAEECVLFPVYVGNLESGERALYVAMNDPTDESALKVVSVTSGLAARPMVACPSEITMAIKYYYYGIEPERPSNVPKLAGRESSFKVDSLPYRQTAISKGPIAPVPVPAAPIPAPPAAQREMPPAAIASEQPPPSEPIAKNHQPEEAVAREQEEPIKEMPEREGSPRPETVAEGAAPALAWTLLDGTTIPLSRHALKKLVDSTVSAQYTKEDLIGDLRAAAAGRIEMSSLPSGKWEHFFAALLEILFRKNLIFVDEFLIEMNKRTKS